MKSQFQGKISSLKRPYVFSTYFHRQFSPTPLFLSKKAVVESINLKSRFDVTLYLHFMRVYRRRSKKSKKPRWTVQPIFLSRAIESQKLSYSSVHIVQKFRMYNSFWKAIWDTSLNSHWDQQIARRSRFFFKKPQVLSFLKYPHTRTYLHTFYQVCHFYKTLLQRSYLRFSHYLYHRRGVPSVTYNYNLYFTFTPNRFYVNLCNYEGLNYLSLSVGLLLKFFKHQKALKKNKSLKFLIVKFLRKLLIVSKINDITIFLKRMPVLVSEVFKFLLSPLPSPFTDPITNQQIIEEGPGVHSFRIWYLYFLKTVSYTSMKGRQKGRVKRKIAKKVISKNRITDEA